ncbi:MAG: hypothetical protein A3H91_05560 [Gammaproteobacteria bacterium RIFCSPLOWO2_02_FULL_61_13]|nr:MAG: hypothetical protein A3H91_05560 [Gammaproteobacteria bacterium RIFCSPLOWO2_02_FULL_61_13]
MNRKFALLIGVVSIYLCLSVLFIANIAYLPILDFAEAWFSNQVRIFHLGGFVLLILSYLAYIAVTDALPVAKQRMWAAAIIFTHLFAVPAVKPVRESSRRESARASDKGASEQSRNHGVSVAEKRLTRAAL